MIAHSTPGIRQMMQQARMYCSTDSWTTATSETDSSGMVYVEIRSKEWVTVAPDIEKPEPQEEPEERFPRPESEQPVIRFDDVLIDLCRLARPPPERRCPKIA